VASLEIPPRVAVVDEVAEEIGVVEVEEKGLEISLQVVANHIGGSARTPRSERSRAALKEEMVVLRVHVAWEQRVHWSDHSVMNTLSAIFHAALVGLVVQRVILPDDARCVLPMTQFCS
jgi:hypothetical protein